MSLKSFNINMPVMFKPTEYGKEYYRRKRMEIQEHCYQAGSAFKFTLDLKLNEQGWCKMQMHDFMEYFGDAMYLGGKPVIELCELVFHEKDLTEFDGDIGVEDKK